MLSRRAGRLAAPDRAARPSLRVLSAGTPLRTRSAVLSIALRTQSNEAQTVPLSEYIAQHSSDFRAWRVKEQRSKNTIGVVAEVQVLDALQGGKAAAKKESTRAPQQSLLCTERPATVTVKQGDTWQGVEVHRIPLVPDLVPYVTPRTKTLWTSLPEGFLDLGRRQVLIDCIHEQLCEYLGIDPLSPEADLQRMPSQATLQAAGRDDLVRLVLRAGGFADVAVSLGWLARRRPHGYWEDPANIDFEIDSLIRSAWTQMPSDEGTGSYMYNQVTGEIRTVPSGSQTHDLYLSHTERVMPTQSQIMALGRTDLMSAINRYGGWQEVAEMLDRQRASITAGSRRFKEDLQALKQELVSLSEELGLPADTIPPGHMMIENGRSDLFTAVRLRGGWTAVASELGLSTRRNPQGAMRDLDTVATALLAYMLQRHAQDNAKAQPTATQPDLASLRAQYAALVQAGVDLPFPKRRELIADGRYELLYALNVHGRAALEERCGLDPGGRNPYVNRSQTPRTDIKQAVRAILGLTDTHASRTQGQGAHGGGEGLGQTQRRKAGRGQSSTVEETRSEESHVQESVSGRSSSNSAAVQQGPATTAQGHVTAIQLQRLLQDEYGLEASRQQVRTVLADLVAEGTLVKHPTVRGRYVCMRGWQQCMTMKFKSPWPFAEHAC